MSVNVWKLSRTPGQTDLLPVPLPAEVDTLDAASGRLPGGAYTTFRTYEGCKALLLGDHLHRLEETARLAGCPVALDHQALRTALRFLAHLQVAGSDSRFRLTVDLENEPGQVYVATEPLTTPPPAAYLTGVAVITCDLQRRLPKAKLTRFIARAGAVRQTLPDGVNEAVMVSPEGCLLEGLSSNFFVVVAGAIWTAEAGVLAGITRSLALEAAQKLEIPVRLEPVCQADLPRLEEAFITSTSRGLLPVRQIDTLQLGPPGPLTQRLMLAVQEKIQILIESI